MNLHHPLAINQKIWEINIQVSPKLCHACNHRIAWTRDYIIIEHIVHKIIECNSRDKMIYRYHLIGAPSPYMGQPVYTPEYPLEISNDATSSMDTWFFENYDKAIEWAKWYCETKSTDSYV